MADESVGRSVPFVFLERVKDDFKQRYGASIRTDDPHPLADDEDEDDDLFEDRFSIAYNLDREFGCVHVSFYILVASVSFGWVGWVGGLIRGTAQSEWNQVSSMPMLGLTTTHVVFCLIGQGLKSTCSTV